jgi:hypothetical protein|tara:strand:- start:799 stop:906 length:108 start_codon:yes stop_codon:yes gene_type:complete
MEMEEAHLGHLASERTLHVLSAQGRRNRNQFQRSR